MKSINEKISNMLEEFSREVNEAILKRNFTKINEDKHTIKIEVLGEIVEIWNVENQETHLYRVLINSLESLRVKDGKALEGDG